jgi:hypothetical protein
MIDTLVTCNNVTMGILRSLHKAMVRQLYEARSGGQHDDIFQILKPARISSIAGSFSFDGSRTGAYCDYRTQTHPTS